MEKREVNWKNRVKKICPSPEDLSIVLNDLQCEVCNLHFKNLARFRMHNLKVHKIKELGKTEDETEKNIQYHCPVKNCIYAINCQRFFAQKRYLKQHYLKIHAEKKFPCTLCPKGFSTEAAKDAHVRVCGKIFDCKICSKSYTTYEALLTHAKRNSHEIDQKYRRARQTKTKRKSRINSVRIPQLRKQIAILPNLTPCIANVNKPKNQGLLITIMIIPKSTHTIAVQTDEKPNVEILGNALHIAKIKSDVTQETQTNNVQQEKAYQDSKETQTSIEIPNLKIPSRIQKRIVENSRSKTTDSIIKKDVSLTDNFSSENLFLSSPLPLRHDVVFPDLWEDKNTSGTQTSPEKDPFADLSDTFCEEVTSNLVNVYSFSETNKITRADPMLTQQFADKFSSIETQTEQAYCQSLFDSDSLSRTFTLNSNNETQTTETLNMEPLQVYNHSCTQTYDDILPSDLTLSNIQTQTAWSHFVDTTVSTETQTRNFSCETGCEDSNHDCRSWLSIQTNHMETQTDIFSMLENLD